MIKPEIAMEPLAKNGIIVYKKRSEKSPGIAVFFS